MVRTPYTGIELAPYNEYTACVLSQLIRTGRYIYIYILIYIIL